jgi:flagellar P-ring protein precursor FlgI
LAFASLQGPNTLDQRVYAVCEGQVIIDNPEQPMVGLVSSGCQMVADVFTPFVKEGCITLVLEQNHANFQTAAFIANEIERKFGEYGAAQDRQHADMVRAKDAANVIVRIPEAYIEDPVDFASTILDMSIDEYEPESRVVINSRAGSIVISGEVEIGDVVVSHKNVTVEAVADVDTFSQIDVDQSSQPRLQELVDQLNALHVPTADMIDIIRGIERNGKLHGKLIIE